jgi:hypothetical protein
MKNVSLIGILILLVYLATAQTESLKIYKLPEKNISRTLKKGAYLNLGIRSITSDSLKLEDLWEGRFVEATGDSLLIHLGKRSSYLYLENGLVEQTIISPGFCADPPPYKFENIPLDKISMIQYKNKSGIVFRKIGNILFFTSFFTGTIVAPLVSFNYGEGTFNINRYKTIAIAAGTGLVISIPIMAFSKKKTLGFEPGVYYKQRDIWTFEKE